MQIRVERLREALGLLKPVVPRKSTLPVVQNTLLKDGKAVATDLETTVILDLPEAEGECLIPHSSALELLRFVPGDELLTIEARDKTVGLSWDGGEASYDVADPADYPPLPDMEPGAEAAVDGNSLVGALTSAVNYCATDESRPVLCGVHLFLGEQVAVGAADGFRLTYQELTMSFPVRETAIIPAGAVKVLGHLWHKAPSPPPLKGSLIEQVTARRELDLALSSDRFRIDFGNVSLIAKLTEGAPPSYLQLLPKEDDITSQGWFLAPDLERAVRRVKDVAKDSSGIVRLNWDEHTLTASATSEDMGKVEANAPMVREATPGRVGLNVSYLLDYLKNRQGVVTIKMGSEYSPVIFRHGQSPLVAIMPMQVQW